MSSMSVLPYIPPIYLTTGDLPSNAGTGYVAIVLTSPPGLYIFDGSTWNLSAGGSSVISITGTANQVIVTGTTAVVLSTPQSIGTSSTPQFGSLGLGAAAASGQTLTMVMPTTGSVRYGLALTGTATVTSLGLLYGFSFSPVLGCSSGTLTAGYLGYLNPDFSGNSATITTAYGLYIDSGATAGTITNSYSFYCKKGLYGTNKYTAFFEPGVGIGAATTDIYTFRVNTGANANTYIGQFIDGTFTAKDGASLSQNALLIQPTLNPTGGATYVTGFQCAPFIAAPNGQTITLAAAQIIYPFFNSNVGTITTGYGLHIQQGTPETGTMTTGYGLYVEMPTYGSTKFCAGFAGIVKFEANNTGAKTVNFGANAPDAIGTLTPNTWIQVATAAGTTAYIPCWA